MQRDYLYYFGIGRAPISPTSPDEARICSESTLFSDGSLLHSCTYEQWMFQAVPSRDMVHLAKVTRYLSQQDVQGLTNCLHHTHADLPTSDRLSV